LFGCVVATTPKLINTCVQASGYYGHIPDNSDPMATMDYTQANKLFDMMNTKTKASDVKNGAEREVAVPVSVRSKL
jgi:hypothetical protein